MHQTRPRSRLSIAAVCIVLTAGLVWGIGSALADSPSASPTSATTTVKIGWTNDPDNLNPFIGTENSAYEVWALNYDFLFGFGQNDEPTPDIAAEIPTTSNGGVSADGLVWTVKLRPNVLWQDGKPLTADDVAFTYNYIIKNNMYAYSFATNLIKEVQVVDPTTIRIICTAPKADLLRLWIPILPKHVWQNVDPHDAENTWENKTPIVGSGPFQTVEVKKGADVKMERNPTYWGNAIGRQPAIDEILFLTYQNPDTMTQDLRTGAIDAAQGVPSAQFTVVQKTPGLTAIAYNYLNWDYLCMNCYGGTRSLGNPILRDPAFRQALNYDINQDEIIRIAFAGRAEPGTTILPPHSWVDPDYHWQPPADQLYTYDPAKAAQLLDAAGYKDTNGDGIREDKDGKPIVLRLEARTESPSSQQEGKLITGWFKALGLDIKYDVVDDGVLESKVWNYQGSTFAPDFDLYLWDWDGYADPGQTLACYTTAQVEGWNEPAWSDPQFDKLNDQQMTTLDPNKRKDFIWQMQQVMYEQSPQITLTYPFYLQAYNAKKWTGWTRILNGNGPAIYCAGNIDTYLNLKPATATTAKSNTGTIVMIIVSVALVVLCLVVWLLIRRRPKAVEE